MLCRRTGVPADRSMADSPNAVPTHSVCTSGLMYFMVSYMANASDSYPSLSAPFCGHSRHCSACVLQGSQAVAVEGGPYR